MKRVTTHTAILMITMLSVSGLGCGEDSATNPPPPATFQFQTVVRNVAGVPVSGLRVSVIHQLVWTVGGPVAESTLSAAAQRAAVTIRFNVKEGSDIILEVLDQMDGHVATLVDERRPEGSYAVVWPNTDVFPSGVYKFVFTALDTLTGDTLYSAWKRSTLLHVGATGNAIGYTDDAGKFSSTDELRFPHLVGPTDQFGTNEVGEPVGTFEFSDSVTIILTDTTTTEVTHAKVRVEPGTNAFNITWDPTPGPVAVSERVTTGPDPQGDPGGPGGLPFNLSVPYPNPYE